MKISDDHMYHGAALLQIAEDPKFTAINSIDVSGQKSRSAYQINNNTGIFLKYASKPSKNLGEYPFTFTSDHLRELETVAKKVTSTFIALVCVKDRQIACLTLPQLNDLVNRRLDKKGTAEDQYVVLVTAPPGKRLRVYINYPGHKKRVVGKPLLIKRQAFPGALFV